MEVTQVTMQHGIKRYQCAAVALFSGGIGCALDPRRTAKSFGRCSQAIVSVTPSWSNGIATAMRAMRRACSARPMQPKTQCRMHSSVRSISCHSVRSPTSLSAGSSLSCVTAASRSGAAIVVRRRWKTPQAWPRAIERMVGPRRQLALLELTPDQREVFVLKHVEGLSYGEIAARLSTSIPSLKMRMHRAYDTLRVQLREHK